MKTVTIVTGNPSKLLEWKRLFPSNFKLESSNIDLVEIQSLDPIVVARDKAERAFVHLDRPVVVDDISAGLDGLHGLPGPFIKYFEEKLGNGALFHLAGKESACTVTAVVAYYDGTQSLVGVGRIHGTVVSPRGKNGFGFDFCFVPDGQDKTYSELSPEQKDKISHRKLAMDDLVRQLENL